MILNMPSMKNHKGQFLTSPICKECTLPQSLSAMEYDPLKSLNALISLIILLNPSAHFYTQHLL